MAVGDIVQVAGYLETGTTVTLSAAQSQISTWATPTSGNTLVMLLASGTSISSVSGWTQRLSGFSNTYWYIYERTSDGTESSITATFAATEDHSITVFEIEGSVIFDVAMGAGVNSGSSIASGTTGTLTFSDSIVMSMCHHFVASDTSFDSGFTKDFDHGGGANGALYYHGAAHKVLSSTAAVNVTGSWTGTADGSTTVVVYGISGGGGGAGGDDSTAHFILMAGT